MALEVQYSANSILLDFFSASVAKPATQQVAAMIGPETRLVDVNPKHAPLHAKVQNKDRNRLDLRHPISTFGQMTDAESLAKS